MQASPKFLIPQFPSIKALLKRSPHLCDPKSVESQAYGAIDGVLELDRLIDKESRFWIKAG